MTTHSKSAAGPSGRKRLGSLARTCGLINCMTVLPMHATELHVAVTGNDSNPGTKTAPLKTIQRGAELAQPGDVVTVHEGIYRERINPPRGGESDQKRIVYQAAGGAKVEIKGSEQVKNWEKVQDDTWKVAIPNAFFGTFNPYSDLIHGDWFYPKDRKHHTGAVYLNGEWRVEAANLDELLKPVGATPLWFGQVENEDTTIWAQFKGVNPNEQLVEINTRQTVFYPDKPGRNYHHRQRIHHGARGHPVGAADGRANGLDRHPLEQGLDHREQHHPSLEMLRRGAGQVRRRV